MVRKKYFICSHILGHETAFHSFVIQNFYCDNSWRNVGENALIWLFYFTCLLWEQIWNEKTSYRLLMSFYLVYIFYSWKHCLPFHIEFWKIFFLFLIKCWNWGSIPIEKTGHPVCIFCVTCMIAIQWNQFAFVGFGLSYSF